MESLTFVPLGSFVTVTTQYCHWTSVVQHHSMKINFILLALAGLFVVALSSRNVRTCKDGVLQCNADLFGAAVLVCKSGRWEVLMNCGPAGSCNRGHVPTCSKASVNTASSRNATQAVAGFENPVTRDPSTSESNVCIVMMDQRLED